MERQKRTRFAERPDGEAHGQRADVAMAGLRDLHRVCNVDLQGRNGETVMTVITELYSDWVHLSKPGFLRKQSCLGTEEAQQITQT